MSRNINKLDVIAVIIGIIIAGLGLVPKMFFGYSLSIELGFIDALMLAFLVLFFGLLAMILVACLYSIIGSSIFAIFGLDQSVCDRFGKLLLIFFALGQLLFFISNGGYWFMVGIGMVATTAHFLYHCKPSKPGLL